MMTRQLLL